MTLAGYLKLLKAVRPKLGVRGDPDTRTVARRAGVSRQKATAYLNEMQVEGFVRGRGFDIVHWRLTPRGHALIHGSTVGEAIEGAKEAAR